MNKHDHYYCTMQMGSMHSLNTNSSSSTATVTRTKYSTAQEMTKKR